MTLHLCSNGRACRLFPHTKFRCNHRLISLGCVLCFPELFHSLKRPCPKTAASAAHLSSRQHIELASWFLLNLLGCSHKWPSTEAAGKKLAWDGRRYHSYIHLSAVSASGVGEQSRRCGGSTRNVADSVPCGAVARFHVLVVCVVVLCAAERSGFRAAGSGRQVGQPWGTRGPGAHALHVCSFAEQSSRPRTDADRARRQSAAPADRLPRP